MKRLKHILMVAAVLLACIVCDQATKQAAKEYLRDGQPVSLLSGILRLEYAENSGAFLSLGASLPGHWRDYIFIAGVAIILTAILLHLLLRPGSHLVGTWALALVCGGGFSNLLDRVRYDGRVVDFLNVGLGSLRTGIFNVADMAIMAGVVMLVVHPLLTKPSGESAKT
jgi:signal peptidase II